ncbi:glycerol-3-phosphate dehydrogenase C-terminal domain-containing protein, partial [Mesorhizobium sp. M7A.F.Ca.CA.004.04.2.1]
RYGTSARDFVSHPAGEQMLPQSDYSASEIGRIIEREQIECLADLFLRRTTIAISGGLSFDLINAVLDMLAAHKGWSASEAATERSTFLALLADRHGIDLQTHQRSALCA